VKLWGPFAILVCFSTLAVAQDRPVNSPAGNAPNPAAGEQSPTLSASSPPGAAPRSRHSGNELTRWQISAGFETYRHEEFRGPGTLGEQLSDYAFHTYGANVTLARYFNNWVGFEGAVAGAFGHTTAPSHLVNRFL
jgi:hypothetical protein